MAEIRPLRRRMIDLTYWVEVGGQEYQVDAEALCSFVPGSRVRLVPRAPAVVVEKGTGDAGADAA